MTRKLAALALVVVISMSLGAVIATGVGASRSGRAAVKNVAANGGTAAQPVAAPTQLFQQGGIADQVDRARKSTVLIEGGNAAGSGVIVDNDGRVVTNFHVVEGQKTLKVTLADGTASRATVLGTDPSSDLAVLSTEFPRDRIAPATLGDSTVMRPGDPVFAIGAPFNQPFTVTSGIVSATGRSTQSSFTGRSIRDMLQTDAAVNPGNSGGPLFNVNGEVVGINTSIENPNGRFFVGLGFAIPSNTVLRLLPSLIAGKNISHAQLGVSVLALDEVIAADLGGLSVSRGLYVTSVQPSSAAARAGIVAAEAPTARGAAPGKGGDVIVAINGKEAKAFVDLARAVDNAEVGSAIQITVVRNGQRVNLQATLQEWDLRGN